MIDFIIFLVVLTFTAIALSILFPGYRSLIVCLLIVYASLPLYLFIASLPIDYRLRIALQLIAFSILMFLALYIILKEFRGRIKVAQRGYITYIF